MSESEVGRLLRSVPFGERLAAGHAPRRASGCALMLELPALLNEHLGEPLPQSIVRELQLIQANLLVHLQFRDDAVDGQSTMGGGEPGAPLASAEEGLARLFPPGDPFWDDYRRLCGEQQASERWELRARGSPLPPWNDALLDAIGGKGAMLRWPASAVAGLCALPEAKGSLEDLCARLLRVALLFDDLADFDDDADRGRINAVLCAGGITAGDALHFHSSAQRGAETVCATIRAELDAVRQAAHESTELAATSEHLKEECAAALAAFVGRCETRISAHLFETLADGFGEVAGTQPDPDGSPPR
ncbi:MAG: hypothetical protein ACJ79H_13040 [Myxococcales bacterium]